MNEWTEQREQEIQTRPRFTVDEDMVERGAFALARRRAEDPLARDRVVGHTLLVDAKAVLDAALGTAIERWHDHSPRDAAPATGAE